MTKTLNLHPPLSTLKERMKHTPKNRPGKAYWDGPRGNSTYVVKPEQVRRVLQVMELARKSAALRKSVDFE